ncbi:MAG: hypothetical protein BRC40_14325 [Cyanobacteria bacterium QH_8_48_120]|jgi:uncharacterized protein (DUF427 family)|nr:MAG: hypothetical protein BRC34_03710 [Cyanobacteria bacterium QH_1_48_107]PSO58875.1 MAG: hypothetical protein BRC35_04985 [Cyanobacteria bacterium QH_10_48_56]PSO59961.1 MAG: hypothetical protein BRC39_10365 [Cyanobacteria bacterium QH_7_48_89]PSO66257.1 MAG: hypothetical protein BRC36_01780 [Cyanobacteria bacterium QH_2_48_84]PSO68315.1 MAG: hypothetical protein BRC38_01700 [Cyanobacteria bacterium QH_6_48_35]PSO69915.1 MAG: hypothetical protein BRC40_14325 [Cyanobacteria bacterium QH_8_
MLNQKRVEPSPGQESVWDYPRPPRLERSSRRIRVVFNGITIVDTQRAQRMLETSHPPVYYLPSENVKMEYLVQTSQKSFCEWKGQARYYTIVVGDKQAPNAAWDYPNPTQKYAAIADHLALYPRLMDACYVDDEQVQSQQGDFYGGWITSDIVGPFKGGTGTWGW